MGCDGEVYADVLPGSRPKVIDIDEEECYHLGRLSLCWITSPRVCQGRRAGSRA
jgi:hypothetical protein